jgi:hypothetical protein
VGEGEVAMTAQVFPAEPVRTLSFTSDGAAHPVVFQTLGGYREIMK